MGVTRIAAFCEAENIDPDHSGALAAECHGDLDVKLGGCSRCWRPWARRTILVF